MSDRKGLVENITSLEPESLTRKLGTFAYKLKFSDLPEEVVGKAKACVLNSLGPALAGLTLPCSRIARGIVSGNVGRSTVIGSRQQVPAADAAFANGVMMHSVAMEDHWHTPGGGHPGIVVLPTVLALAEERLASGQDVICALVAGYELYGRVYLGLRGLRKGFRGVPTLGPFGGTAAAGKLIGLSEDEMVTALEYAANFAGGLNECWWEGTMEGVFHAGMTARNSIMAATIAGAGANAAEHTLEGQNGFYRAFSQEGWDLSPVTSGMGQTWYIMDVLQKLYPACANNQLAVDLACTLRQQHQIDAAKICKVVEITSNKIKGMSGLDYDGPFANQFQAQLSIQFCVASALLGRAVDDPMFYIERCGDPDVAVLAKRVEVVGEPERPVPRIDVFMHNGTKYSIDEDRRNKLFLTFATAKGLFERLAPKALSSTAVQEIIGLINNLEHMPNIQELTQKLSSR